MSGGSLEYVYQDLNWKAKGKMHDAEMNDLIRDLIPVLKACEWWKSGDSSAREYREEVEKFKAKWFGDPDKRRAELAAAECDRLKRQLKVSFGLEPFDPNNDPWNTEDDDF